MPLDEHLPSYQWNEVHSTRVAAPPDRVLAAVRELTAREVPLLVVLMGLRRVPDAIKRRSARVLGRELDGALVRGMTAGGFVVLAEQPDELVLGVVGRFWTRDGGVKRVAADRFAAFDSPGFAKGAINFHALAEGDGTLLTTETRVQATDDSARRSFGRYWRLVGPFSALIRRDWLRAVRRRAERR